jgi:hypothetical protein
MTKEEKKLLHREVGNRFNQLLKDYIILSDLNNPFSDNIVKCPDDIKEIHSLYMKFDGVRNSINNEDSVQKHFESFLELCEEIVKKVKETTLSLSASGEYYEKLEESRAIDFAKAIKTQVIKFKAWIDSSINKMKKMKEIIKQDISNIEKQIQKEFNF